VLAQAEQMLMPSLRACHRKALRIAVDLRGGADSLPGRDEVDAMAKVIEGDWVYRQLTLYEYGGLATFLRDEAAPDLVAGADRIHDWARAPMRVLRFVGRSERSLRWRDLAADEEIEVMDLGGAAMVVPGECVLGRVVPVEEGAMLEGVPLRIPEDVAADAALDPPGWLDALRRGVRIDRPEEEKVFTAISSGNRLLTDVPEVIWQLAALQYAGSPVDREDTAAVVAEAVITVVRAVMTSTLEAREDELDPRACVGAALVDPVVLERLPDAFSPEDAPALAALADSLVGPAAEVCRELAGQGERAA
jgi:hypothetical protein